MIISDLNYLCSAADSNLQSGGNCFTDPLNNLKHLLPQIDLHNLTAPNLSNLQLASLTSITSSGGQPITHQWTYSPDKGWQHFSSPASP